MTLRKISKIPVRTLTDKAEIMNKESSWLFGFCFCDSDSNPFEILETIEEIIIHVHGGGFVAGSSSLFLPCTLKWASETGVPIFSIDYRLSPNYKYPAALQDCWEIYIYIYIWILKYGKTHLNINPSKIILIGDSAGGNLIIGLTILAIQNNIKVPDQLICAYPALDFRNNSFYPSILYGYTDLILNVNIIKVFRDAYINHEKYNENDPCLSPLTADDSILERFPETCIMTGSIDPFRDQAYKFTHRLKKLDVDVKLIEYAHLPHGFLNLFTPFSEITGVKKTNEQISLWIKKTVESNWHARKKNSKIRYEYTLSV